MQSGQTDELLHSFVARAGDVVFIPAGTVHALGAGLLVAEIQQSSDTTFRLFDWNRVDADGLPRPLHIDESLRVIDFSRGPVLPQQPMPTEKPYVERLVACDKFVIDRWQLDSPRPCGGDNRFHLLAVIEGTIQVPDDPTGQSLKKGCSALIPAACDEIVMSPQGRAVVLDMYLP